MRFTQTSSISPNPTLDSRHLRNNLERILLLVGRCQLQTQMKFGAIFLMVVAIVVIIFSFGFKTVATTTHRQRVSMRHGSRKKKQLLKREKLDTFDDFTDNGISDCETPSEDFRTISQVIAGFEAKDTIEVAAGETDSANLWHTVMRRRTNHNRLDMTEGANSTQTVTTSNADDNESFIGSLFPPTFSPYFELCNETNRSLLVQIFASQDQTQARQQFPLLPGDQTTVSERNNPCFVTITLRRNPHRLILSKHEVASGTRHIIAQRRRNET